MMWEPFPKMARYHRLVTVTEKIDGTNAAVIINEDGSIQAASRTRIITPDDDNYGFARWVSENSAELSLLGVGVHFGEWWGQGIQRNYSQTRKRFSLFNTKRWGTARPDCCDVVPVLYHGVLKPYTIVNTLNILEKLGSKAAPGFMKPEGVCMWHDAAQMYFKATIEKDDAPKNA